MFVTTADYLRVLGRSGVVSGRSEDDDVDAATDWPKSRDFSMVSYSVLLKPPRIAASGLYESVLFIMYVQLRVFCVQMKIENSM